MSVCIARQMLGGHVMLGLIHADESCLILRSLRRFAASKAAVAGRPQLSTSMVSALQGLLLEW